MSSLRSTLYAVVAAGLVGAVVPAAPAQAYVVPAKPAFGGYTTTSSATPLKIEVYEPTIPVPATPQAEASLAYTKVQAATGPNVHGRASWLWPGDPVGEGCKTFVEQLGLGGTGLCKDGYPVQVNSGAPDGDPKQADEPFPGTVMRTSASAKETVAKAGYSPDGDVSDRGDRSGKKGKQDKKGGDGPVPGLPGLPGLPTLPGPSGSSGAGLSLPTGLPQPGDLSALGAAITGKQSAGQQGAGQQGGGTPSDGSTGSPVPAPPSGPALPPALAALVDVGAMSSISRSVNAGKDVTSTATSSISDLSLLGGLITADSVKVSSATSSNGKKATADGLARVVGLAVAGNGFTVDRNGVHPAGPQAPIPGLPDNPAKALKQLGISFVLPKGEKRLHGADGEVTLQGLQIVIDTRPLRAKLDKIPFDEIVGQVPDSAGQLKSLLGAAVHLAPKFVITAGNAATAANTVPAIALPDVSGLAGPATAAGGGAVGGATGGAVTGGALSGSPGAGLGAAGGAGSDGSTSVATQNAAAGLPPLASVPGALMVGGILLASGLGWWLQKIGAFVLGGAGSCSHGLETGVPDLRKA